MRKYLLGTFLTLAIAATASAQVFGPTTRTPRLTVTGDLTVGGTCTGCGGGGGTVLSVIKPAASSTDRTSATASADPDLQLLNVPAGTYFVFGKLLWAPGAGAFKVGITAPQVVDTDCDTATAAGGTGSSDTTPVSGRVRISEDNSTNTFAQTTGTVAINFSGCLVLNAEADLVVSWGLNSASGTTSLIHGFLGLIPLP